MMKIAALRDKSQDQLIGVITELKKERLNLRMKRSQGDDIKPHRLAEIRRQIAQAMTILHEKNREAK